MNDAIFTSLVPRAEQIARDVLSRQPAGFSYHSIEHTELVVRNAMEIANFVALPEGDLALLLAAAWLHDTGIGTIYSGHERESCAIARAQLGSDVHPASMDRIEGAILATQIPQRAESAIAEILCDADLLYMGGNNFMLWSDRLREEHTYILNRNYSDSEWLNVNIHFVSNHRYYTPYARERYAGGMEKNLTMLRSKQEAVRR